MHEENYKMAKEKMLIEFFLLQLNSKSRQM